MYHSHLLINVGDNPDRPDWNITRKWLRNLYRVHQRLSMAFQPHIPTNREERVAAFCAPYAGGCEHDRSFPSPQPSDPLSPPEPRSISTHGRFLFRIDHPVDYIRGVRRPVIIVQSAHKPDWDYAFGIDENARDGRGRPIGNAAHLLAAPPQCREISIEVDARSLSLGCPERPNQSCLLKPGDLVRFRLRANPICKRDGRRQRPRIPETDFNAGGDQRARAFLSAHEEWLHRKLAPAAAEVGLSNFSSGWAYGWRSKHERQPSNGMQWWSVLFEGNFRLQDPVALKQILETGVGPAKAFGFGLLSIAPVSEPPGA